MDLDSLAAGQCFQDRIGQRWFVMHVDQAISRADAHVHLKLESAGTGDRHATYLMRAHEFRVLASSNAFEPVPS